MSDGEHGSYRPPNCGTSEGETVCWWRVEDLGQIFEACWTPFANPASARWVDYDIVRDPARWAEQGAGVSPGSRRGLPPGAR